MTEETQTQDGSKSDEQRKRELVLLLMLWEQGEVYRRGNTWSGFRGSYLAGKSLEGGEALILKMADEDETLDHMERTGLIRSTKAPDATTNFTLSTEGVEELRRRCSELTMQEDERAVMEVFERCSAVILTDFDVVGGIKITIPIAGLQNSREFIFVSHGILQLLATRHQLHYSPELRGYFAPEHLLKRALEPVTEQGNLMPTVKPKATLSNLPSQY